MGEDVALCLEVQVDPESKKILSNPQKCRSTLLDVTVLKPKELEAFGTQQTSTLRVDEVRKLIASMEKRRRKKQKVLNKLKGEDTIIKIRKHDDHCDSQRERKMYNDRVSSNSPIIDDLERKDFIGIAESVEPLFCEIRRSLRNVETRITNMKDINIVISETTVEDSASENFVYSRRKKAQLKSQPVYRMETRPPNLKSILLCKNQDKFLNRGEVIEGQCLCENCGIIGLLTHCQKNPLLDEPSETYPASSAATELLSAKKKTRFNMSKFDNFKNKKFNNDFKYKNFEDVSYISHLTKRVEMLEEKLAQQQERTVSKDYFTKVITKLVTKFSLKGLRPKSDTSLHFKKINKLERSSRSSPRPAQCNSIDALKCFNTSVKYQNEKSCKTSFKADKATITDDELYYGQFIWKWGEEILKPGIDLKNRIVTLLTEILSKFALGEKGPVETPKPESSKMDENYNSELFKRFMQHMKIYNAQVDTNAKFSAREGRSDREKSPRESEHYKRSRNENLGRSRGRDSRRESDNRCNKKVSVSYVNPNISLWRTDSPDIYKTDEKSSGRRSKSEGRKEFLKILEKAKHHQKEILWKNIWSQAKANHQTRSDKITIKVPKQEKNKEGERELFETEITIGEVEKLLLGDQNLKCL